MVPPAHETHQTVTFSGWIGSFYNAFGWSYLLTYLIGHNNSFNGFRPAATHPSRRLCFLCAYGCRSHQWMTRLPRYGLSNGYNVVSPKHPPPYEQHGRARSSHWILIRCPTSKLLGSLYSSLLYEMRNSLPTRTGPRILRSTFLTNTLKAAASLFNSVHASAP